jgi:putative membrane protein insertion efficiency factor
LKRLLVAVLVGAVRVYQRVVAPWLPPSCRYEPSCSAYMVEALRVHGPFRGAWMGAKRVLRCSPLHRSGFDPVPPRAER